MQGGREWLREKLKEIASQEREQGRPLNSKIEVWKRRDRRGHIASVASIVCFCVPVTLMLLWLLVCLCLLLCWYWATQSEEASALVTYLGVIMGIVGGVLLAVVTSTIGTVLGLYAVLSTEWRRGKVGLVVNVLLLLGCCACILLAWGRL